MQQKTLLKQGCKGLYVHQRTGQRLFCYPRVGCIPKILPFGVHVKSQIINVRLGVSEVDSRNFTPEQQNAMYEFIRKHVDDELIDVAQLYANRAPTMQLKIVATAQAVVDISNVLFARDSAPAPDADTELDFDFADATAQHLRKLGELVDRVLPQVIAQEARKRGKRYVVRKNYDVVYLKEFCFGVWDNKAQEWTGGVYTASQAQAECDRLNAAAAGGES